MKPKIAAGQLAELGHITRLSIFRLLVKAGRSGISVGEIQEKLDIPGSTLSHHLSRMMKVDLMEQQRDGRTLHCHLKFAEVEALLAFLYEECCAGELGSAPKNRKGDHLAKGCCD
ncbi:metalloregulator ArsR/SmtB family transcription factor [Aliiglaciecola sp. CAU 1673]|uniref:ArsR/SmtB family transcription factor n=1 Tax=Aliiglaciecola sp. CAU 1673 TaxID=3032595 RepID=UPI0023DA8669|nr:metalloregulator ArsR/SmtB family transcription factor [Aliiglaciecola sp. CAU 1673]MDF2179946.1 metalloregulator ArsR/SmtB family transcription factor [Aliiglaciecola sp. CAU 1673]